MRLKVSRLNERDNSEQANNPETTESNENLAPLRPHPPILTAPKSNNFMKVELDRQNHEKS